VSQSVTPQLYKIEYPLSGFNGNDVHDFFDDDQRGIDIRVAEFRGDQDGIEQVEQRIVVGFRERFLVARRLLA
jgi:hypothetical protein